MKETLLYPIQLQAEFQAIENFKIIKHFKN